jgi:hypothetical protein
MVGAQEQVTATRWQEPPSDMAIKVRSTDATEFVDKE